MNVHEKLAFEASKALRGAPNVVERMDNLMKSGSPSIKDVAYALKMRTKDDYKIIDKVLKKKEKSNTYSVNNIRDIVGLRIVNLYRLDALNVIPILLDRIEENSGNSETDLFWENPIEEVIIYSVNPTGDAQNLPSRIFSVFESRNYKEKTTINESPQNYSSTHIVAWCRGKYNGEYLPVPVEIQIRTALEDVWSEIDHQLKYKRQNIANDVDSASIAAIENCLSHLGVMKTLNDGLAQYGDQVKIQISEIDQRVKRTGRSRLAEEPTKRLETHTEFSGELKKLVCEVFGETREVINNYKFDSYSYTSRNTELSSLLEKLEKLRNDELVCSKENPPELQSELDYVIQMETALVYYELGKGMGKTAGNNHLLNAQQIYSKMESLYPRRGIVQFRHGRVLASLSNYELAIEKLESLLGNLDSTDIEPDHWVVPSTHRLLGYYLWDTGAKLRTMSGDFETESDRHRFQEYAFKAIAESRKASLISVKVEQEPNEVPHESDRIMSVSNTIFFVVEFIEAGGSWSKLAELGLDSDEIKKLMNEVSQFDRDAFVDHRKVNTLRRAYHCLGEKAQAIEYAQLAVKILEDSSFYDRGGNSSEETVLRHCKAFLEDNLED
jgi:ppGpp synthetase/RelA/SpoT-type nucleotidyltranferase/tetratricopeptide (TPR) repeat protein